MFHTVVDISLRSPKTRHALALLVLMYYLRRRLTAKIHY